MRTTSTNDFYRAYDWLVQECQVLLTALRAPQAWLAFLAAIIAAALAYQYNTSYTLAIGGDPTTRLRHYDAPFLNDFHASEPQQAGQDWWQTVPYRWSRPQAQIRFPGLGSGPWMLAATMSRPADAAGAVRLSFGSTQPLELVVSPQIRTYHLLGKSVQGDLLLQLDSQPYQAASDERELGTVVYRVVATSLARGAQFPAIGQVALHGLLALLIYLIARRLVLGTTIAFWAGIVAGLALALVLALDRLGLAITTPGLLLIVCICWLLAPLLYGIALRCTTWLGFLPSASERGIAVSMVLSGFAARMIGITHPYAQFSDLIFNANNFARAIRGNLFLTAGLPCEAGAGIAPYPPALYLISAPLQLLYAGATARETAYLIQGSVALFESLGALWIWLLLRKLGSGRRAALLAAALYTLPPPLLGAYSVGEMANLFGQAWVPLLLLAIVLWPQSNQATPRIALLVLIVAAVLLSHTGVTISALCLLVGWWVLSLPRFRQQHLVSLTLGLMVAGGIAGMLFYSAFLFLPQQNQTIREALATRNPPLVCPPGNPLGTKLMQTVGLALGERGLLQTPLVITATIALISIRKQTQLQQLLIAAVIGTLLSFVTLLSTDQPVRWAHFLFPVICIAAGITLAAWQQRGHAGRWYTRILLAGILALALIQWVRQVSEYLH
jgi:hypothetical protein